MRHARVPGQWAVLLAASAAASLAFAEAALPAALLLGPMAAAIACGVAGFRIRVPRLAFQGSQGIVGCLVAHAVTGSFVATVVRDGWAMLPVVLVTVAASAATGLVLTRLRVLPGTTAAWGSSPGGAAAMTAMAEEYGADPRHVAFMQYVRVVCVAIAATLVARIWAGAHPAGPPVATAPDSLRNAPGAFAATLAIAVGAAWAARRLRVPAGALMGPLAVGAVLQTAGIVTLVLPPWLLGVAYATAGWYVGLRFTRATVLATLRGLPQILIATLGLIALCGLWAWLLTRILSIDFLTAFLATSPGGLDTVAIIAVGSGADTSFVLGAQTLRLVVVLFTGPPIARFIARSAGPG